MTLTAKEFEQSCHLVERGRGSQQWTSKLHRQVSNIDMDEAKN